MCQFRETACSSTTHRHSAELQRVVTSSPTNSRTVVRRPFDEAVGERHLLNEAFATLME